MHWHLVSQYHLALLHHLLLQIYLSCWNCFELLELLALLLLLHHVGRDLSLLLLRCLLQQRCMLLLLLLLLLLKLFFLKDFVFLYDGFGFKSFGWWKRIRLDGNARRCSVRDDCAGHRTATDTVGIRDCFLWAAAAAPVVEGSKELKEKTWFDWPLELMGRAKVG